MKVLDPQSALLTTVEVQQFLRTNIPRPADKKIGSYATVNLHNYQIIRSDFENYINLNHPEIKTFPPAGEFMKSLIVQLQLYDLTKAEVFTLINLGVGIPRAVVKEASEDDPEAEAEAEDDVAETELSKSLFRLVVEESEQRFEGEEGEQKIDEILDILKNSLQTSLTNGAGVANGHGNTGHTDANGS